MPIEKTVNEIKEIAIKNRHLPYFILKKEMEKVSLKDGDFEIKYTPHLSGDGELAVHLPEVKFDKYSYEKLLKAAKENGYFLETDSPDSEWFDLKEVKRFGPFKWKKEITTLHESFFNVPFNSNPHLIEDIGRIFYGAKTSD